MEDHWMFFLTVACVIVFGGFGGMLGALQWVSIIGLMKADSFNCSKDSCVTTLLGLLVGAVGGAGGAFAGLFVMLIDDKIAAAPTVNQWLLMSSVFVLSGFLGIRFLKIIANRFENAIEAAEHAAEKVAHREVRVVDAIGRGLDALRGKVMPSTVDDTIHKLEVVRDLDKSNRRAGIVLGRLYAEKRGDYESGIRVLNETLEAARSVPDYPTRDVADLKYNLACYYTKLHEQKHLDTDRQEMRRIALKQLAESVKLSPQNKKEAREDDDFASLKDDKDFLALTSP